MKWTFHFNIQQTINLQYIISQKYSSSPPDVFKRNCFIKIYDLLSPYYSY